MEAKVEKIENSEAYIKVIVDAEQMEKGMEKAYKQLVKKVNIPGFRKGRVPRPILEAHLGKEALYQDAMEFVIPAAYQEAVDKLNIQAIASPEFENIDIEDGLFKFDARVAVKPDIKLGNLEGLEISIPKFEVTEEHVDERLKVVQESYAQLQEKTDKPAENGDKLVIDFEGFIDEVPFPGGKGENYSLELGANVFVPGFEEQLIGVMTGEEKEVKVTFPEDYHADEVAGKEAVFKVKVNKIETKVLRALDDEFAQEVSQFDTMSELRQDLKESMQKMGEHQKKEAIKEAVIAKALERCEIPLAESVVREQIEKMKNQLEERMKMQGVSLEQYLQMTNSTEEELNKNIRPDAEYVLKSNFMLEKLMEEKGFDVTDEEIDEKIEQIVKDSPMEFSEAKERFAEFRKNIEYSVKMEKTINYLIENAVITEQQAEEPESQE